MISQEALNKIKVTMKKIVPYKTYPVLGSDFIDMGDAVVALAEDNMLLKKEVAYLTKKLEAKPRIVYAKGKQ